MAGHQILIRRYPIRRYPIRLEDYSEALEFVQKLRLRQTWQKREEQVQLRIS
jgi:hypothetical protein